MPSRDTSNSGRLVEGRGHGEVAREIERKGVTKIAWHAAMALRGLGCEVIGLCPRGTWKKNNHDQRMLTGTE